MIAALFLLMFQAIWVAPNPSAQTAAPTSVLEASADASAIDMELDVYIADADFALQERVAIRRVQNDLHMLDSQLYAEPYVSRVQRLVSDWNALVRLDQTLAREELL
jgi:hypothetical protein